MSDETVDVRLASGKFDHDALYTAGDEFSVPAAVADNHPELERVSDANATESDSTEDETFDKSSESATESDSDEDENESGDLDDSEAGAWLTSIDGVGKTKADDLEDAGYAQRERIIEKSVEDLAAVDGISRGLAEKIKRIVGRGDES